METPLALLVSSLTDEHTSVLELFANVRDAGLGTAASNALLACAGKALQASIHREETDLFPALHRVGVPESLRSRVRHSMESLGQLKVQAAEFLGRWSAGGEGLDFARDFGGLVGALQFRMRMDETYLYAPFKQLLTGKSPRPLASGA